MKLHSQRELEVTREKLRGLEELYARTETGSAGIGYVEQLTLRSLRRTINQLKEEIRQFETLRPPQ
jgi:hypothetical protein